MHAECRPGDCCADLQRAEAYAAEYWTRRAQPAEAEGGPPVSSFNASPEVAAQAMVEDNDQAAISTVAMMLFRHHDPVTDMDLVLQALAERGAWHGSAEGDAELVRIEIRRAARRAGIKVPTFVDARGRPHACTPDGWPAHEPWRGAAIHAHESGAMGAIVMQALDRLLRNDEAG